MGDREQSWEESLDLLAIYLKSYSIQDVASSLFVSSLWLPNNGSTVKHQLHVAIFGSINPNEFSSISKITSYKEFKIFCESLYKITPSFPSLEDYVPNFDWGSVKFHHNKINYKIFYGTEISHIYDFLMAFQLIYVSFDKEYQELSNRSPSVELKQCLYIQNKIIENIDSQPVESTLNKITLGHIEVPKKKFWLQSVELFNNLSDADLNNISGQEDYSMELGSLNSELLKLNKFGDNVFDGSLLPFYFIRHQGKSFPILPRRFSGVLIDRWSRLFSKYSSSIKRGEIDYQKELTIQISNFLQSRFHKDYFYPFVSAVYEGKKPHELLFSGYLLSEEKLVLFYIVRPFNSQEDIEKQLEILAPKFREAIDLINKTPMTLALHLIGKNVVYKSDSPGKKPKIELFVILPQATNQLLPISGPKDFPWEIVFIDQFLGVIDELERHEEFSEFIDYLRDLDKRMRIPITTLLDKFGSFRDSSGVLIPGANEPNMIMIDLQWGTDFRYKSLKSFWEIYPEVDFMDHPRSWIVKQEGSTRVRLLAKSYLGCAFHLKIITTNIFLTSPLDTQDYEEGTMSNLILECLEDYMSRFNELLSNHSFFKRYVELVIIIFPDTLLTRDKFSHIQHLAPMESNWKSDVGYPKPATPGIRLTYNYKKLREIFKDSTTNDIEVDLLVEIFSQLNTFYPDPNFKKYLNEIKKEKGRKPRFKTIYKSKGVAFPEHISPVIPNLHDHKLARKTEAYIALTHGIKQGRYKLTKAKNTMNELRKEMVKEIDREVSQYSYDENIKYLVTRIDALINNFVIEKIRLEESLKHEVDFIREEHYSKAHAEFTDSHKDYRYLLEKFVQITPKGTKRLNDKSFRYLVALVDKIQEIYNASDSLNYELYPVGLTIDRDFLFQVKYKDNLNLMQKKFSQDQARIELGSVGNESDRAESAIPIGDHLDKLDEAFKKDFGFGLKNLVNLFQVMTLWPGYKHGVPEAPFYIASKEDIEKIAEKVVKGFDISETQKILDFITLTKSGMLTVLGSLKKAEDLPVWEHQNRPFRYAIKPVIKIGGKYLWGPHSTERSGRIWINISSTGILPADLTAPNVNAVLRTNQISIEKGLEKKALEISKRYTKFSEQINYGRGTHDQSLGDYDVLAYLPQQNILLNIECKDIVGVYCLKDAKRLRERIFRLEYENGRKVKNPGNLIKVEKRELWLKNNTTNFAKILKWPIKKNSSIISIYITRTDYWWTKFPPRPTTIKFLRIDLLSNYIEELLKIGEQN